MSRAAGGDAMNHREPLTDRRTQLSFCGLHFQSIDGFKIREHLCGLLNVQERSLPAPVHGPLQANCRRPRTHADNKQLRVSCLVLQLRSSSSQLLGSPHCSRLRLSLGSFTDRKREEGERERWQ